MIDLRSDTVTLPSEEMRRAMAAADLGDDVFGEDPTVNRLEARAAELMGKEAALLVPSGTMSNLIALLVHARTGQEVIVEADSHVFLFEAAGAAAVGGIQLRQLRGRRGVLSRDQICAAVRSRTDVHQPVTAAVCFENTHNRHGGAVWPLEALREAAAAAREHGLGVHLDGSRIFNAAMAVGVPARDLAAYADTVNLCLSKGLGCPVGSMLAGSSDAIESGRRWRKMLGGGMRQAGVIAAAGEYAFANMIDRLSEDHATARLLAEGMAGVPGLTCDPSAVETNIVMVHTPGLPARAFLAACRERGLLGGASGQERVRFVTHYGIEREHVEEAIRIAEAARAAMEASAGWAGINAAR